MKISNGISVRSLGTETLSPLPYFACRHALIDAEEMLVEDSNKMQMILQQDTSKEELGSSAQEDGY